MCYWWNTNCPSFRNTCIQHLFLMRFVLSVFCFLCKVLKIIVYPFVHLHVAIVLSVFLQFTASDYPFSIFKLFFPLTRQDLFWITEGYNELIGEISNLGRCLKTLFIVCVSGREPKSVMLGLWSEVN